jgi:FkbM family methyltransferase
MVMNAALHSFARLWPLHRGRDAFMRRAFARPAFREHLIRLPEWIRTRENFLLRTLAGDDYTSLALKLWGDFEPHTKSFILREMREGGTFLDLGANVGYFSILATHSLKNCRAIAFEPNPDIASRLCDSARENHLQDRVQVVVKALSDKAGTVSFGIDAENSGHSRLALPGHQNVIHVEAVVLDDWLVQNVPDHRVCAIKLDIEGAEMLALRGMTRLLSEQRPALIIEGFDDLLREFGSTLEGLKSFVRAFGYEEVMPVYDGNTYWKHESEIT